MNKVILVINLEKKQGFEISKKIISWLQDNQIGVVLKKISLRDLARGSLDLDDIDSIEKVDCIMVLGGDGTILNCARTAAKFNIPVLGINLGQLGFLTEIEVDEVIPALKILVAGEYRIEERMMIEAVVYRKGEIVETSIGLNDAVITKGAFARLIDLEIAVNNEFFSSYAADGLIIASPTGSTAYSLSAGGPLVPPDLELMLITPICPHTLTSRPLVISAKNTVKVSILSFQNETMLTLDGQHGFYLEQNDEIRIRKAPYSARFIKLKGRSFFSVVREKLRVGRNRHD